MSKKSRRNQSQAIPKKVLRPAYRVISPTGVVPIAKPASNIQLTPIVQPVSFLPYSTQAQPMAVDEEYDQ